MQCKVVLRWLEAKIAAIVGAPEIAGVNQLVRSLILSNISPTKPRHEHISSMVRCIIVSQYDTTGSFRMTCKSNFLLREGLKKKTFFLSTFCG